jgi:hypothetical protein
MLGFLLAAYTTHIKYYLTPNRNLIFPPIKYKWRWFCTKSATTLISTRRKFKLWIFTWYAYHMNFFLGNCRTGSAKQASVKMYFTWFFFLIRSYSFFWLSACLEDSRARCVCVYGSDFSVLSGRSGVALWQPVKVPTAPSRRHSSESRRHRLCRRPPSAQGRRTR